MIQTHADVPEENNPETGLNNVYRNDKPSTEAGEGSSKPVNSPALKDQGDRGRQGSMQEQYASGEGHDTIDEDEDKDDA